MYAKSLTANVRRREFIVKTGAAVALPLILPGYVSSALPGAEESPDRFFYSCGKILINL
jgi:hypothetical protein